MDKLTPLSVLVRVAAEEYDIEMPEGTDPEDYFLVKGLLILLVNRERNIALGDFLQYQGGGEYGQYSVSIPKLDGVSDAKYP